MSAQLDKLLDAQRLQDCARNDAAMAEGRRIVPFNTGRVLIGRSYIPRPAAVEGDAVAIQRALLEPRTEQPATGLRRVFAYLWSLA